MTHLAGLLSTRPREVELHEIWGDIFNQPTSESIERQVRRYNQTLRRLGAGFEFRYSRTVDALILDPSDLE